MPPGTAQALGGKHCIPGQGIPSNCRALARGHNQHLGTRKGDTCCSLCMRHCRRSDASDLKPSFPERLPHEALSGQTILKSPCRSLRANGLKPNAHRFKSPSSSISRQRVSQGSLGAEAGWSRSELTQSCAPLSENALSPEVQGQLRLSQMEIPGHEATV